MHAMSWAIFADACSHKKKDTLRADGASDVADEPYLHIAGVAEMYQQLRFQLILIMERVVMVFEGA